MSSTAFRPTFRRVRALADFADSELDVLAEFLQVVDVPPGEVIAHESDADRSMYFIAEGAAVIHRGELDLGRWDRGDHFGELGMITGSHRAASVIALTPMRLLKLEYGQWTALQERHGEVAIRLLEGLLEHVGHQLTGMTDTVRTLLMQRSSPRHLSIHVRTDGEDRVMPTGVHPSDVLPCEVDGKVVVAALIDNAIYPLDTPIPTDVTLRPLTTAHWEGQRIYRRSAGLLLLEAACELAPGCTVSLASSVSGYQWIDVFPASGETIDLPSLAARLEAKMREYVERDVSFRHEWWVVAEAARYFEERGWGATARLLDISRDPTVRMVSCGKMYVLGSDALISHAGCIRDFAVRPVDHRLVLIADGTEDESAAAAHLAYAEVMRQHDLWLRSLGIHGVGDFNARCVNGEVSETILVGEGFHEKRITMVADEIAARPGIRIVCIAGPSSSGKTTFIKRLRVQLQVHGLDPVPLSLDDYYADREKCPRDASGEFDFEALEALDLDLLAGQLRRLLAGETVRVAHFDFATGTSRPEGGRELHLGENTILMLEGIHGLNPGLLGDAVAPDKVFRVFIQPLASLAFDRLSRVNPSDLRLIRRIVRDRHTRDCSAAQNIARWPSVRRGEHAHIFPFVARADAVFDSSLTYELSVLKVYAERYLLEVPRSDPGFGTALRLRQLIDRFVAIYPDHVPPTSILREFIGSSSFEY